MKPDAVDFNLRQTVENNLQLYTSQFLEKDIDIKIDIDEKINLHGDLKMFDAIIRNLLSNALKYSHSGGQIKVTADAIGTHAEIHITDFGVGMSEKVLNSLFVPGQTQSTPGTNAERGTGFGLLLIFDFLRLNNGTIKVESQLNQGTTFRINWPLA
jgi:signal transduction histidine kinase